MGSPKLLLVDQNDNLIGYASQQECHTGRGRRHRAFVTVVIDSKNQVILQRRRHRFFDGLWDLTAISHPLHLGDKRDESYQEASDRALAKEMGIDHVAVSKVGAFNYFARDGKNCENEYCAVLVGNYDGKFIPNKKEVYEAKKVKFGEFVADISKNPQKYTPWARLAVKKLTTDNLQLTTDNLLQKELKKFLNVFEPYQQSYFAKRIEETKKYSPLISKFYKDLADFCQGGKKLRGFLVWVGFQTGPVSGFLPASAHQLFYRPKIVKSVAVFKKKNWLRAVGDPSTTATRLRRVLPVCLAYEIAHNFLLIHDDIIDRSDMRRGKLTMHKRYEKFFGAHYGGSQAMIIGDVAFIEAMKLINETDFAAVVKNATFRKMLDILLLTAWGQALDVEYAFRQATFGKIWQMVKLKAAKYSVIGPLTIGAFLAGASRGQLAALSAYGEKVGIAFQIQDDILGVFGNEKVLGKSTLSDMREGKNTILIYKTRELARSKDVKTIDRLWGKRDGDRRDIRVVGEIIEKSGALEWCQEKNRQLIGQAKPLVGKITGDRQLQSVFNQLAEYVATRQS